MNNTLDIIGQDKINNIEINLEYKKKYFKYKNKYLLLKKKEEQKEQVGKGFVDFLSSATDAFMNSPMGKMGMNLMIKNMPPQQRKIYEELKRSGLINEQNKGIFLQLAKNSISHFADPKFYPILFTVIENCVLLATSTTLAPPAVFKVMLDLYGALNNMKEFYPDDFIILSKFIKSNKSKLLNIIHKVGYGNDQIKDLAFNIFEKLIYVDPKMAKNKPPQQQMPQPPQMIQPQQVPLPPQMPQMRPPQQMPPPPQMLPPQQIPQPQQMLPPQQVLLPPKMRPPQQMPQPPQKI